ncbi:uncharacterized protein BO97DRAFT_153368 [Aspergillus homomorphus CBS 101889]|uniref:Uncharacterized protein n=1 Tax=Aspergillus homomorphus (strain CBS 101889) TaxID=1450537 RepID=A0A395HSF6_ASPHC|nr:hypothetical protein BO97DRAFT_153368 [Aspergillus homomorphus CBS 101889]RAL09788.1 hypothetical protein BO97DRAFT_153368 [Aspergillus homomorphus CBS 101889]
MAPACQPACREFRAATTWDGWLKRISGGGRGSVIDRLSITGLEGSPTLIHCLGSELLLIPTTRHASSILPGFITCTLAYGVGLTALTRPKKATRATMSIAVERVE